jgi:uncharacterized protein
MAVFLSPGVFTREVDLSTLPAGTGALRPAFIGAAQKGPVNVPTLITSAQQFTDIFGDPFPESYLGYAVLAFLEEGSSAYVLRVGVQYQEGMDTDLAAIAIDTSGSQVEGWGRTPAFAGIDNGIIRFRRLGDGLGTNPSPIVIHAAGATAGSWNDADIADESAGAITSTVTFSSTAYTGCLDEVYTLTVTSDPTLTGPLDGATYVVTDSAGDTITSGTLGDGGTGLDNESGDITLTGTGIVFSFTVDGEVGENDTLIITAQPDNTTMTVVTEGGVAESIVVAASTYTNVTTFIAAINAGTPNPTDFTAVASTDTNSNDVPAIRTDNAGEWIQLQGTCAFAAEVGISQWSYDIPRSYLIGSEAGPYNFSTANNRVVLDAIAADETVQFDFEVPAVTGATAASVAASIDANAAYQGTDYFDSFALTVPGGTSHVVIITSSARQYDQLKMQATFSFLACLRFAEEIGVVFPYTLNYRSFWDSRVELPAGSTTTPALPLICETAPGGDQCALDTDYYANIVGWFVAKYAGEWIDNYTIDLAVFTEGVGDAAGRFKITVKDLNGLDIDVVEDVSFDPAEDRYIANVVNEDSTIGGVNGNAFYSWEQRPSYLGTDDRIPAAFASRELVGGENGIPADAEDSTALDNEVIGNPSLSTGIYAFQNPESFDFNLLLIPGFASGPVIAQAIQFCENRGDVLYLVDPPYGLRPQQVIDWHNGMLTSDLTSTLNTSYGALYWSWLKINDTFNGGTIWVPPSGHVASVFARTERETETWFAPAGLNRGRLLSALDIEYNPTQGERDALYGSGNAVNAIVNFTNQGITIWGQRTLQRTSTALDRVNVRMLMIFLKKNLQRTLRAFVFEQNDETTRDQITAIVNPFLADIAARRGLTAYNVVCNETNNTPERIDRHELWVSVFIKPTQSAEFIVLNLVTLRTGANFGAQEVLAAGGVVL